VLTVINIYFVLQQNDRSEIKKRNISLEIFSGLKLEHHDVSRHSTFTSYCNSIYKRSGTSFDLCKSKMKRNYEGESKSNGEGHLTALIEETVSNFS